MGCKDLILKNNRNGNHNQKIDGNPVQEQLAIEKQFLEQTAYLVRLSNQTKLRWIVDFRNAYLPNNTTNMYDLMDSVRRKVIAKYANRNKIQPCLVRECPPGNQPPCGCMTGQSGYSCMDGTWYLVSQKLMAYVEFNDGNVVNSQATTTSCTEGIGCKFTGNYYGNCDCADGAAAQLQALYYLANTEFFDTRTQKGYGISSFINSGFVFTGTPPPADFVLINTYNSGIEGAPDAHAEQCYFDPTIQALNMSYPTPYPQNPFSSFGELDCAPPPKNATYPSAPYSGPALNWYSNPIIDSCTSSDSECQSSRWWYNPVPAPFTGN